MDFFYTSAMEGETPFNCYVCGKMLVVDIKGEYTMKLMCSRCKTVIVVETKKPLPNGLVVKHGELVKGY